MFNFQKLSLLSSILGLIVLAAAPAKADGVVATAITPEGYVATFITNTLNPGDEFSVEASFSKEFAELPADGTSPILVTEEGEASVDFENNLPPAGDF